MTLKDDFIAWYFNEFHNSVLAENMRQTTEDSPWHQERNVMIHTDMVVSQYLNLTGDFNQRTELLGALACAFHDTGKPDAMELVYSEDRGYYRKFYGHERISARVWENYIIENSNLLDRFKLTPYDIYCIGWMIYRHLPYNLQKEEKRIALYKTIEKTCGLNAFFQMMTADCIGRITDQHDTKKQAVYDWMYKLVSDKASHDWKIDDDKVYKANLYMPIAASNSGKSTWINGLNFNGHIHSWDQFRFDWYDPNDYRNAFTLSCADDKFADKARKIFIDQVRSGEDIIVDNTNLRPKQRLFFIDAARQRGYRVNAVLFPVSIQIILERSRTRTHQHVPEDVVLRQYMSLIPPSYGEFDNIEVIGDF